MRSKFSAVLCSYHVCPPKHVKEIVHRWKAKNVMLMLCFALKTWLFLKTMKKMQNTWYICGWSPFGSIISEWCCMMLHVYHDGTKNCKDNCIQWRSTNVTIKTTQLTAQTNGWRRCYHHLTCLTFRACISKPKICSPADPNMATIRDGRLHELPASQSR